MSRPHQRLAARLSAQRVLLALYRLSDTKGLTCVATNRRLATIAGRSVETVRSYLRRLEQDGTVTIVSCAATRVIVLRDHPDADEAVREPDFLAGWLAGERARQEGRMPRALE